MRFDIDLRAGTVTTIIGFNTDSLATPPPTKLIAPQSTEKDQPKERKPRA